MNLTTVHQSLQIVLGEAKTTTDCDITASWAEWTVGTTLLRSTSMVSAGTSAVTVVAAPPNAATWEQVKEIRLHNNDTVTHKVTLQLDAGGTPYIVLQSSVAAGGDFVYTPDAGAAAGASGTVTDVVAGAGLNVGAGPGGSITNTGTLNVKPATTAAIGGVVIGSGITVNSGGTISSSGGGGGSYTAGLGLYLTSGTFGNTGTIEQPAATGTNIGIGILLLSGLPGIDSYTPGEIMLNTPDISNLTPPSDEGLVGGNILLRTGSVYLANGNTTGAYGGFSQTQGSNVYGPPSSGGSQAGGAYVITRGGTITNAGSYAGGSINLLAGGTGTIGNGGNVNVAPGTGATNGVLLVSNIGTVDPHVLNAKWQTSVAGVGYVGVYSKG